MVNSADEDAQLIYNAFKIGKGKEKTIINIIANRSNAHRIKIIESYKNLYQNDLIEKLNKEISGDFCKAVMALFYKPMDYDIMQINHAIEKKDYASLIEIVATRPNDIIKQYKENYEQKYKKNLLEEITKKFKGCFLTLIVELLKGNRSTNNLTNKEECLNCAKELVNLDVKQWEKGDSNLNKILSEKSPKELLWISKYFHKLTNKTILEFINQLSKTSKEVYLDLLYSVMNPPEFFARRIEKSVKGIGTDDNLLIRIIITRDEIDITEIKHYYQAIYKKDMIQRIKEDVSGNYCDLLVELAGH